MCSLAAPASVSAVAIPVGGRVSLDADVVTPANAKGIILFVPGCGSERQSPRNRYVAAELNYHRLATVLADLLTPVEEEIGQQDASFRSGIPLLTRRVVQLIDWSRLHDPRLPIGLFGAGTGAAAALDAAATRPQRVRAVVTRGGRLDLASQLGGVVAPTLLIVGSNDSPALQVNGEALRRLHCRKELEVIPGASHLFDEPGTLEAVASAAGAWFREYLPQAEGESP